MQGGSTSHPILSRLLLARYVNAAHGAPVVAAWEIDQLPDDWLDTMISFATELPSLVGGRRRVEAHFARWRAQHPTYRKHLRQ